METRVYSWSGAIAAGLATQQELIAFKLSNFESLGWGGCTVSKWGGTADPNVPLIDGQMPLACVSFDGGEMAGMSFVIENDLANYPISGEISSVFTGDTRVADAANPWFAGHFVADKFRGLGLSREQEQWVVAEARRLVQTGAWTRSRSRLWLFTEREPLPFLPEMYARSGWQHHRSFRYDGMQRWVMFQDLLGN